MSNQLSNNNKNWLYFAFGLGTTLLLGTAFILVNLNRSKQSLSAGTWKIEAIGVPEGTPAFTIIISPEGKVLALNPRNEKEAIEVGKIAKISDISTLPEGTKMQSNSLFDQSNKAKQSEAKTYVGAMNRGQQAYYLEKEKWGQNVDALGIGIKFETENYRYNTQAVSSIKTVNIKNYPGITVQTGIARKEGLKSYLGVVYLSNVASGNDTSTINLLCESNEPTTKEIGLPKFDGKKIQCPDGYSDLYR